MTDEADILLRLCESQWTQGRHSEDQRSTMTNFIIVIAAAVVGVMVDLRFDIRAFPLAILLVLLGSYGALACAKLYERWELHMRVSRHWLRRIEELYPNVQLLELWTAAGKEHRARYRLLERLRLHWLWFTLHTLIALSGVVCSVVIAVFYWL